MSEHVDIKVQR